MTLEQAANELLLAPVWNPLTHLGPPPAANTRDLVINGLEVRIIFTRLDYGSYAPRFNGLPLLSLSTRTARPTDELCRTVQRAFFGKDEWLEMPIKLPGSLARKFYLCSFFGNDSQLLARELRFSFRERGHAVPEKGTRPRRSRKRNAATPFPKKERGHAWMAANPFTRPAQSKLPISESGAYHGLNF